MRYAYAAAGEMIRELNGKLIAICCDVDPVTDIETVTLFTDDGYGNGDCIAMFSLADLLEISKKHEKLVGIE